MSRANLETASKALQGLKSNPEALKRLDVALTGLRHDLGMDVDDETFRYILNALVNQKVMGGTDLFEGKAKTRLPGGFQIMATIKEATL